MKTTRREAKLIQLIAYLWDELRRNNANMGALEWVIRQDGLAWALPEGTVHHDDNDWLTPTEIAHELGYSLATIHTWAHRYKPTRIKGRYRWGDIRNITDTKRHNTQMNDTRVIS